MKEVKKGFEKGSTVYLTNVKRWIDSNGSVVLTVRRSGLEKEIILFWSISQYFFPLIQKQRTCKIKSNG